MLDCFVDVPEHIQNPESTIVTDLLVFRLTPGRLLYGFPTLCRPLKNNTVLRDDGIYTVNGMIILPQTIACRSNDPHKRLH